MPGKVDFAEGTKDKDEGRFVPVNRKGRTKSKAMSRSSVLATRASVTMGAFGGMMADTSGLIDDLSPNRMGGGMPGLLDDSDDEDYESAVPRFEHENRPNGPIIKAFTFLFQPRPKLDGEVNIEGIAWAMDSAAKGPLQMSGAFLGPALLVYASQTAESNWDGVGVPTVFGIPPSSLLTMASVFVSLANALIVPVFGNTIDYATTRRRLGFFSAVVLVTLNGLQSFITYETWVIMLCLFMSASIVESVNTTVTAQYLTELTDEPYELGQYTAWFCILHFMVQSLYTLIIVIVARVWELDNVNTARVSHCVSFFMAAPLLLIAWGKLFGKRTATIRLPEGRSILAQGFRGLRDTAVEIMRPGTKLPNLRLFMLSMFFCPDLSTGAYSSMFVTYMALQLKMTGDTIGLINLVILLSGIPGSFLSNSLCRKLGALKNFRYCLLWWVFGMTATPLIVSGPERAWLCFPFAIIWGIQFGWLIPSQKVLFCTIIPSGNETGTMSCLAFFQGIMGWFPPMFFSWINNNGYGMRLALASGDILYILCMFFLHWFDYEMAVEEADTFSLWRP